MICGLQVREAVAADLPAVKGMVDGSRQELGFVPFPALVRAMERGWLLVAEVDGSVSGAVSWWSRRDGVVALYNIVVLPSARNQGLGQGLLQGLIRWATTQGMRQIRLKCPEELPSNGFYARAGFTLTGRDPGKRRALNEWVLDLHPPCGALQVGAPQTAAI